MPEFTLLDSYYGERGYRQYAVYRDGKAYHLNKISNTYLDNSVYVDNMEETLENIIFSIEMYYYECLKQSTLTSEEFINQFNLYQENLNKLYYQLSNIYTTNKLLKKEIDEKLHILFSKNISIDARSINMLKILENDINLETIVLDLYKPSLAQINTPLISITINTNDKYIVLDENKTVEYLTPNLIYKNNYIDDSLMSGIKSLYIEAINLSICYDTKEKLKKLEELCNYLNIL